MKYKALMLDVDGTLIPYQYNALPSDRVAEAVKKAQEKVSVCLVTGRAYSSVVDVLKKLGLHKGFAVLDGGANVINVATQELLSQQPIDHSEAEIIIEVLRREKIEFYIKDKVFGQDFYKAPFGINKKLTQAFMIFAYEKYTSEQMDTIASELKKISHITFHKTKHRDPTKAGFNITHALATKARGVEILLKQLNVTREEIIGVGDSYNDFPLLMASGLKVAMGNAVEDLKAIADYIAPSVNDDGVADVIEKFILS